MTAHPGFSARTWKSARTFGGHCATPADVEGADAVFALGETLHGRPLPIDKPAPVIWYDEDEEFAALVVQAEAHETEDDVKLEMLGLLLPSGETVVAHLEWRLTDRRRTMTRTATMARNGPARKSTRPGVKTA